MIAVGGLNPDTANLAARDNNLALVGDATSRSAPPTRTTARTSTSSRRRRSRRPSRAAGYRKTWGGTSAATPHVAGARRARHRPRAGARPGADRRRGAPDHPPDRRRPRRPATAATRPGWDRLTGWGRVNALRGRARVEPRTDPAGREHHAPEWYRPVTRRRDRPRSGSRALARALDARARPGRASRPSWRTRGRGRATTGRRPAGASSPRPRDLDAGGLDAAAARDRRERQRRRGPRLLPLLRRPRAAAGLSRARSAPPARRRPRSPTSTATARAEIVLATSDGLRARARRRTGARRARLAAADARRPGAAGGPRRIGAGAPRASSARPRSATSPATSKPEVVAAGLDGRVYAWDARAAGRCAGSRVRSAIRRPAEDGKLDAAIYASPALADLDRDGKLDIVVGAADQQVYAWNGRRRDVCRAGPCSRATRRRRRGEDPLLAGGRRPRRRRLARRRRGHGRGLRRRRPRRPAASMRSTRAGKLQPGWPVQPAALAADSIPLAGEGVPGSPVARRRGRRRPATRSPSPRSPASPSSTAATASGVGGPPVRSRTSDASGAGRALARDGARRPWPSGRTRRSGAPDRGGPLRLFGGLVDARLAAAQLLARDDGSRSSTCSAAGTPRSGELAARLPGADRGLDRSSPRPAIADVDGDGRSEAIAGSSGYLPARLPRGRHGARGLAEADRRLAARGARGRRRGRRRAARGRGRHARGLAVRLGHARTEGRRTAEWPSFRHDPRTRAATAET